jgi:hypothetical protein
MNVNLEAGLPGAPRPLERNRITGIHVRLRVGGARYLHVYVSRDGVIARSGRGERDFEGSFENPGLFSQVLERVSPELLRWAGQSWSDPSPRGKTCELLIAFRESDGRDVMTRWEYGTESPEPPEEIRNFILSMVEATNPWYRRQIELRQERAQRRPDTAWRLVPARTEVSL